MNSPVRVAINSPLHSGTADPGESQPTAGNDSDRLVISATDGPLRVYAQ